jgi:sugar phosphate isomerase/epimerase
MREEGAEAFFFRYDQIAALLPPIRFFGMSTSPNFDRRAFLTRTTHALMASGVAGLLANRYAENVFADSAKGTSSGSHSDFPIAIFTKVFQTHTFAELSDAVAVVGADGVEATIRSKGHIDPEQADTLIPEFVEALAKNQKKLLIAATGINEADKPSEKLLKVLRDNGVRYYRMGYYRYEKSKRGTSKLQEVREAAAKAKDLAAMNRELGVVGLYQNHYGKDYVGSLIWDLAILFEGIDRQDMGVALDLRHLHAEISGSYQTAVDVIRPHLRSIFLKDTRRDPLNGNTLTDVPLGEGLVSRDLFRDALQSITPAPISLHVEYFGQNAIPTDKIQPVVDAYRRDLTTLRGWIAS